MKTLRDYQEELSIKGVEILKNLSIVYFCMQVRTGKTGTALNTCKLYGAKKVLFLTKVKAIKSIESDYLDFGFNNYFEIKVINNESLHKVLDNDFDIIIMDEAHRLGAFPKPSKIAKDLKLRFHSKPFIFLSGTPHPESYSQVYHQFWVSDKSPFKKYINFYNWYNGTGFVKVSFDLGFGMVANYSNNKDVIYKYYAILLRNIPKDHPQYEQCKEETNKARSLDIERMEMSNLLLQFQIDPYMISYTQIEAGFETDVIEHILTCDLRPKTHDIINRLKKNKVIEGKDEVILADTAVKLMGKIHQLCSGTIKFESGNSMTIDNSKAWFIKKHFSGKKIGIFYKFKEELQMLKEVFEDDLTTDLDTFNITSQNIALQIVSGREGISLSAADYLIFLNIDFSAISYFQAKDRLTTMERKTNDVYWIFSKGGIEEKIYKTVQGKKDYTLSAFTKDFIDGQ
jgi:hypothetical protein